MRKIFCKLCAIPGDYCSLNLWINCFFAFAVVLLVIEPVDALTLKGTALHELNQPGIVGINFEIKPQTNPIIQEIYPATPAAKAGLLPGDEVIAVNSTATRDLSASQLDEAISDIPGDIVILLIKRRDSIFSVKLIVESLDSIQSLQTRSLYNNLYQF